jgi:hypothetical protein
MKNFLGKAKFTSEGRSKHEEQTIGLHFYS